MPLAHFSRRPRRSWRDLSAAAAVIHRPDDRGWSVASPPPRGGKGTVHAHAVMPRPPGRLDLAPGAGDRRGADRPGGVMPESAASPTADQPTVTVVGEGTASAAADTALLQLGVETRGATPGEALEACSRALEEVIAAVRAAGVQPPWLATGELSVHPDWEVVQGQQRSAGYRAAAQLTARLDAPARAGQVATAAVTAGGEAARMHGLMLVVGDQAGVLAAAREAAWRDARGRAEQYAALAGVALGEVLRIEEVAGGRHALALAGGYQAQAAAGPAVEVGEAEVGARVAVTWALLDAPAPGAGERS